MNQFKLCKCNKPKFTANGSDRKRNDCMATFLIPWFQITSKFTQFLREFFQLVSRSSRGFAVNPSTMKLKLLPCHKIHMKMKWKLHNGILFSFDSSSNCAVQSRKRNQKQQKSGNLRCEWSRASESYAMTTVLLWRISSLTQIRFHLSVDFYELLCVFS